MKRIITLLSCSLLAFIPAPARADLGDTIAQGALKYGAPSATGNTHILAYTHAPWRIWQTYNNEGVCIIAEFSPLNHGPLTPADCVELDRLNLPAGLMTGNGPGWDTVRWPNTISYQYTDPEGQLYQVMDSHDQDGSSRMYLNTDGIAFIKSLPEVGK